MSDKKKLLEEDEDFFIPTLVTGFKIPIEEMSDLEYFKYKLFDALKRVKDK